MAEIINNIQSALPTIFAIFIVVFLAIIATRLAFIFLMNLARKKYQKLKKIKQKIIAKRSSKTEKKDEELFRKKEEQKSQSTGNQRNSSYEILPSQQQEQDKDIGKMDIVDIVKPIGFFTSMILGQKLTYLIQSAQIINKRSEQGFWVSMVEAQEKAAGRQHGRGR